MNTSSATRTVFAFMLLLPHLARAGFSPEQARAEVEELLLDRHAAVEQFQAFVRENAIADDVALTILQSILSDPEERAGEYAAEKREKAVWCIGRLESDDAFDYAERLAKTGGWPETTVFCEMALENQNRFARLSHAMNQTANPTMRFWVYENIRDTLQTTVPTKEKQTRLLRFLLERTTMETIDSRQLDEILCREVPKWRASPQRAANAVKMLREHPGDAPLAAFFEGVRADAAKAAAEARAAAETNVLHAAASRLDDSLTEPFFAATANVASTNAPAASAPEVTSSAADINMWADLLSDLPEKKPWIPPEGYDPPF